MEGEIFVVTLVAIGCITGLIKAWINKGKNNSAVEEESFNRLARAFMQHKKEMQERVEKLETIISDQSEKQSYPEVEAPNDEGSLTNDLQEKNRVRS